jgi:S1-C subfamily serine protease
LKGARRALLAAALLASTGSLATGLPEWIARLKPGVVVVGTFAETDSPRFQFRGSGFAVGDGLSVVTRRPCAARSRAAQQPGAAPADGDELAGRRAVDATRGQREGPFRVATDLALLRLEGGEALPALRLGPREPLAEGSEVALMGFPIGGLLGFSHVTHRGTISAWTQLVPPQSGSRQLSAAAIRQVRDGGIDIYQLDALAYPGNSGGPVFDPHTGEVVGVLSMGLTRAGREGALSAPTGISYAIPVRHLHELMAR